MSACPRCGETPVVKRLENTLYVTCKCRMLPETERRLADAEIVQPQPDMSALPWPRTVKDILFRIAREDAAQEPAQPTQPTA